MSSHRCQSWTTSASIFCGAGLHSRRSAPRMPSGLGAPMERSSPSLIPATLLATWDEADGAQRTKLLSSLFERIEAHVAVPERGTKFRTKRQADAVARLLADQGHEVEWVRKNYGAQRESTWNVSLADGTEVHLAGQLEDLGLALPREAWPTVGRVKVTAVPKEGWRRFFEYVPLERETGFEPATSTLARLRSTE